MRLRVRQLAVAALLTYLSILHVVATSEDAVMLFKDVGIEGVHDSAKTQALWPRSPPPGSSSSTSSASTPSDTRRAFSLCPDDLTWVGRRCLPYPWPPTATAAEGAKTDKSFAGAASSSSRSEVLPTTGGRAFVDFCERAVLRRTPGGVEEWTFHNFDEYVACPEGTVCVQDHSIFSWSASGRRESVSCVRLRLPLAARAASWFSHRGGQGGQIVLGQTDEELRDYGVPIRVFRDIDLARTSAWVLRKLSSTNQRASPGRVS